MKKMFMKLTALAATLLLTFGTATTALAAENNGIHVNGTGHILVQPDTATIYFSFTAQDKTADSAQAKNNALIQQVSRAMVEMGVDKEDIETAYSYVYPAHEYDTNGKIKTTNYQAYARLHVNTSDIDHVGNYVDKGLAAGATGFDGASFSLEDPSLYYSQALQLAVKNANLSAQALASACDRPLGNLIDITELSSNQSYEQAKSMSTSADVMEEAVADTGAYRAPTKISYQEISVSASVHATYEL